MSRRRDHILYGVASLFDLFGTLRPPQIGRYDVSRFDPSDTRPGWAKDREALASDWRAVGADMDKAIVQVLTEDRAARSTTA